MSRNDKEQFESVVVFAIYKWGLEPMLLYLNEQEEIENYEACEIIDRGIISVIKERESYTPKKIIVNEKLNELKELVSIYLEQKFALAL